MKSLALIGIAPAYCSSMSIMTMTTRRPRILCLHGANQSASIFSQKIGGARRKLARPYDLVFLDGPVERPEGGRTWWTRHGIDGTHTGMEEALAYVRTELTTDNFDAVLGFSQGGTLATALAVSGVLNVRAVVTAGAPHVPEMSSLARTMASDHDTDATKDDHAGFLVPKLHLAGETDAVIPVESVRRLSEDAGSGTVLLHEQGHLFPTRAAMVKQVVEFLAQHLTDEET